MNAPVAFRLGDVSSTYTDANGRKIVNILDQAGQIVSSSDEVGLLPKVKRNLDNLITQQTDARGNTTSFTYDAKGNVITTQDSLSFSTGKSGSVLILNGTGFETTASTNNLTSLLKEAGLTTTVVNTLPTDLTSFSEIWDIRFDNSQPVSSDQETQYISFLQSGKKLFVVGENSGFPTRNNSLISLIDKAGGGTLSFTSPSSTQQVSTSFKSPNDIPDGNVTFAAPGGLSSSGKGQFITSDNSGSGSALIFNEGELTNASAGKLVAIFDINFFEGFRDTPDSVSLLKNLIRNDASPRRFTYDSKFNLLTSRTDELGHQTLYQIDSNNGNLLSLTQVVGTVGGDDDLVSKFTYTDKGLVDLITDPLGRVTDSDYDARGRLTAITYAKGTVDEAKQQFEYDAAGNQTAIIDENGNATRFEYDALSRLVKITEADPDGVGALISPVTTYTYDVDGNLGSNLKRDT